MVEYTYDNLSRVTLANYPGSADDIAYTYDQGTNGNGHLTTMVDPAGTISFGYDARGRLKQKASTIGGINYQPVIYFYTPGGRVDTVTYPSMRTLDYTRDGMGRIESLRTTYNSVTKDLATGLTYRPFGGPLGLTNSSGGIVNNQAGECECLTVSNEGQYRERWYGYDANRNLTSITGTNTPWYSQTFVYDELKRLTSATGRYGTIAYTYDDVGNRLTRNTNGVGETYAYVTGKNRLHDITEGPNPRTFEYDDNGNITSDGTLTFIYDQNNQLKEVTEGQTSKATYTYNGLGQRVKKMAGGVTTIYHYDLDGKLIAESLLNGTFTKEYLYMGKVRVAMVDVAGGGTVYAYQNDRLRTPELLTTVINDQETVVWEAWYEPFGEAHIHPSSSVVNNIRLPGQYFDSETGLHYNYHRYYDPKTGRYLTPDPIGLNAGMNLYLYIDGNPINLTDPLGLVRWRDVLNSSLGLLSNSLGLVVGSALLAAPEPTLVTKAVGGVVLGKSVVGWGLNWYNLTQAFTNDCEAYDVPSSALRAMGALAAPGNTDVLLAADALDLGIDLMSGRARVYSYGTPTLQGTKGVTRPYHSVSLTFTHPGPVKTFQAAESAVTVKNDLVEVTDRLGSHFFGGGN